MNIGEYWLKQNAIFQVQSETNMTIWTIEAGTVFYVPISDFYGICSIDHKA
jgi:hypothetical protein